MCDRIPLPSARERALVRRLKLAEQTLKEERQWLIENANEKPCPDFEPECVNCQMFERIIKIDSALASLSKPLP